MRNSLLKIIGYVFVVLLTIYQISNFIYYLSPQIWVTDNTCQYVDYLFGNNNKVDEIYSTDTVSKINWQEILSIDGFFFFFFVCLMGNNIIVCSRNIVENYKAFFQSRKQVKQAKLSILDLANRQRRRDQM